MKWKPYLAYKDSGAGLRRGWYPARQAGARINAAIADHKGGQVGKVGDKINSNRYFYEEIPAAEGT